MAKWDDMPIVMDATEVVVRGDALHPIWWRGREWAVTTYGLEKLDGTCSINVARLGEDIGKPYGWPAHMGDKGWVDMPDFLTAWLVALALHEIPSKGARASIAAAGQSNRVVNQE